MIEYTDSIPGIRLIGKNRTPSSVSAADIREIYPGELQIVTTDFPVTSPVKHPYLVDQTKVGYFYPGEKILSIDHHYDDPDFSRIVSSTNLAIVFIKYLKQPGKRNFYHPSVSITHTDADSILASGILAGLLPPDERFGEAAIATDHTGEKNEIGDLLMAMEHHRNPAYSFHELRQFLRGRPLSAQAKRELSIRESKRLEAARLVENDLLKDVGNGVYYGQSQESIPAEFFSSLIPRAKLILLAIPMKEKRWEVKTRIGNQFPAGRSLFDLRLEPLGFGGRWNAGSTNRSGGCEDPILYMETAKANLGKLIETLGAA